MRLDKLHKQNGIRRNCNNEKDEKMAFITETFTANVTLAERFATLRDAFVTARAQRKVYTATVTELSALSNRDLADLGISRSMIKRIALEAAYEN
mgnify:CR=1 FL=1